MNPQNIKATLLVLASSLLFVGGCYDSDDRCGENQTYSDPIETCICIEGAIVDEGTCTLCGAHTIVVDNTCICDDGYAEDEEGACIEISTSAQEGFGSESLDSRSQGLNADTAN